MLKCASRCEHLPGEVLRGWAYLGKVRITGSGKRGTGDVAVLTTQVAGKEAEAGLQSHAIKMVADTSTMATVRTDALLHRLNATTSS